MRMGFFVSFAHDDVRRVKNDLCGVRGIWDRLRGQTEAVENYQIRLKMPVMR